MPFISALSVYYDSQSDSAILKRLADSTGGSFRTVEKPEMGTTADPAVEARDLSDILQGTVADDTATLFLLDMSPSSFPKRSLFLQHALNDAADKAASATDAQVGLALFSSWDPAWHWTSDEHYVVLHAIGSSSLDFETLYIVGGSNIDGALQEAHTTITDSTVTATNKVVVLISDGISGVDVQDSTLALYGADTDDGVLLDTVALRAHADQKAMQEWASEGDGELQRGRVADAGLWPEGKAYRVGLTWNDPGDPAITKYQKLHSVTISSHICIDVCHFVLMPPYKETDRECKAGKRGKSTPNVCKRV